MRTGNIRFLTKTCVMLAFIAVGDVAWSAPGEQTPTSDGTAFQWPRPRLAPVDRTLEDEARLTAVRAQIEAAIQEARASDDPAVRAEGLLQAANKSMTHLAEPYATDQFLRIEREDAGTLQSEALAALDQTRTLLADAANALAKLPADAEPELRRRAARLDAFAFAMRIAMGFDTSTEPAKEIRQAVSKLSPLLESSEPAVAGAAAFWRACVLSTDPDPRAAFDGLELSVSEIPKEAPRYGFFKRLIRCRLVAAGKGEPAALALLAQVEERIDEWFQTEADRLDAIRTIGLFQLQTLQAWYDRLDEKTEAEERGWCIKEMVRVCEQRFAGGDSETVLRLIESVPLLHIPAAAPPPDPVPEKAVLPPPQ